MMMMMMIGGTERGYAVKASSKTSKKDKKALKAPGTIDAKALNRLVTALKGQPPRLDVNDKAAMKKVEEKMEQICAPFREEVRLREEAAQALAAVRQSYRERALEHLPVKLREVALDEPDEDSLDFDRIGLPTDGPPIPDFEKKYVARFGEPPKHTYFG
jgi:hypothetical protein